MSSYRHEWYQWLKDHHIYTRCTNALAFGKYTKCPKCIEKQGQYNANYRFKHNVRMKANAKKSYENAKENGLCVKCWKPAVDGHTMCETCLMKQRQRHKARYVFKVKQDGICRWCDKPVVDGKKLCAEHIAVATARIKKAREYSRENHPWRVHTKL